MSKDVEKRLDDLEKVLRPQGNNFVVYADDPESEAKIAEFRAANPEGLVIVIRYTEPEDMPA